MNDPRSGLPAIAGSALDLIGRTPMVEVRHLDTGPCRLFLKLENQNPGGSIKDRVARAMIEAAEADGRLKPGDTSLEAGRLGSIAIEGDNILLGQPFLFTKDNIDQFDF